MTKKQKQMVVRIVVAFIMLVAIMVGEHTGLSGAVGVDLSGAISGHWL